MTERRPLTHHEILALIEPFTRRGRRVDLAASDRLARRLLFMPIAPEADDGVFAGATETLQLENLRGDLWRLVRAVTLSGGAAATLTTEGSDLGALLDRIETVSPRSHFKWVGDVVLARSYRLEPADAPGAAPLLILASAQARLDGLVLDVRTSAARGYPADLELTAPSEAPLDLPEDLLAVLGWDWRVLEWRRGAWVGTLRAPGREPERSRRLEAALETAVAHLARTLAEPPRRFHARFAGARWGVVFRRMIPLLATLALLAVAVAMVFMEISPDSLLSMLMFNAPPILLAMLFTMREIPRLEIPAPPRPSRAPSWFAGGAPGAPAQDAVPAAATPPDPETVVPSEV